MYHGHFNFENGYILVVLFIATPAKTKSLFNYCIKIQSQPMTVVKYNNWESIGQQYWIRLNIDPIDVIWGEWVGEIITSIRHYLWQHEYGRGPLFILCYWWFGNVGPAQHILYDHVIFSMTMSSVKFCSLLWLSWGGYQRLCSSLIIIINV
jgi:hypothetical protein